MDITQITELAKQGGRLASDKQWELADALAQLTDTEITQVAVHSKRNESTLHQYARAAQRWPDTDRVQGVSFSAHRVALSWHDPRGLLVDLKHEYGSPTVKQVRRAMGLEGHPAIEQLEKGISKLDRQVSRKALGDVVAELATYLNELNDDSLVIETEEDEALEQEDTSKQLDKEFAEEATEIVDEALAKDEDNYQGLGRCKNCGNATSEQYTDGSYLCDECDEREAERQGEIQAHDKAERRAELNEVEDKTWTPPITTSDIAGI